MPDEGCLRRGLSFCSKGIFPLEKVVGLVAVALGVGVCVGVFVFISCGGGFVCPSSGLVGFVGG